MRALTKISARSCSTPTIRCSRSFGSGSRPSRASARRPTHERQAELPCGCKSAWPSRTGKGRVGDHASGEQRAGTALRQVRPGPPSRKPAPSARRRKRSCRPAVRAGAAPAPRIGEMIAAQVVEDEPACRSREGSGLSHRYNAVLKRVLGNKGRAEMTLAELEAALAWLERNRLAGLPAPPGRRCALRLGGTSAFGVASADRPRRAGGPQGL